MNAILAYREMTGLTRFLKVLLGLGAVLALISMMSSFMQAELLSRESFSEAEAQANDIREQMIGVFQAGLYLLTVVVFGVWIVRANKNVRALGAVGLQTTPGWALGYFFVPILNLWRPYQAMKDLWRASHSPLSWMSTPASSILPAWWTLWLGSNFLSQISLRVLMRAETIEGVRLATYFQIAAEAADIPLCLVAMALVSGIARAQEVHVRSEEDQQDVFES